MQTILDWTNLRSHYGSKNASFEQLCSVLFHRQVPWSTDSASKFVRLGRPDGGVECYWQDGNGRIHALQAKYFVNALGNDQWKQVASSFEAALTNHANLTTFVLCIPQDLPGGRVGKAKSAQVKWAETKAKLEQHATNQGRSISIQLWGNHELAMRLTQPVNRGVAGFFFNAKLLTHSDFRNQVEGKLACVSTRYHPEVHVEHSLEDSLEELVQHRELRDNRVRALGQIRKLATTGALTAGARREADSELSDFITQLTRLETVLKGPVGLELESSIIAFNKAWSALYEKVLFGDDTDQLDHVKRTRALNSDLGKRLVEAKYPVDALEDSARMPLAMGQAAMLVGSGGCGKTHLFCHFAMKCVQREVPVVLALGHQLDPDTFWHNLMSDIGCFHSSAEFLEALSVAAEVADCRAIILIDALNEADKHHAWAGTLRQIVADLKRYPYITLAVSVRDIYEQLVWPRDRENTGFERLWHEGFGDAMDAALSTYLNHYNIAMPDVPPLHNEFSNPLLLAMFCQAIAEPDPTHLRPPARINGGFDSFGRIFTAFLKRRQEQLRERHGLDIHRSNTSSPLLDAIEELATCAASSPALSVSASECDGILRKHLRFSHYDGNPVILLEQDGILLRHTQLKSGQLHQRIGFAFDRMGAHFVVNAWLRQYADAETAMQLFSKGSPLLDAVNHKMIHGRVPSLIEALITEWRERFAAELFDLHGRLAESAECRSAFLSSLAFVQPEHFTESTSRWLISFLDAYPKKPPASLDQLLPLIGRCRVPSMTAAIHQWLANQSIADRDAWWTVNIAWHGDGIPLLPVVSWAAGGARGASRDERLAAATALAWCTTTTNGFARSKLTKAIVHILDADISIANPLLEMFQAVSDPYVLQSVAQAIHGACLRSSDASEIVGVANTVVRLWPNKSDWPCDLIIRDELLGILECAVFNDPSCGVAVKAFEPPYPSVAPSDAPTWMQVEEWRKDIEKGGAGMREVIDSCMPMGMPGPFGALGYGDFGRYVVSSRVGRFFQRERFGNNREPLRTEEPFERDFAHRWIIGRVKSLGWTVERFQQFESRQLHAGRSTRKRERIGKKYQWIALSEFLARATDRFPMHDHSWRSDDRTQEYRHASELLYESHCDTSLLLESKSEWHADLGLAWWDRRTGASLNAVADNVKWLRDPSDFPDPQTLIQRNDDSGDSWLALWGHYRWHTLLPQERPQREQDNTYREIWTHVRGHLIRPADLVSLRRWMLANRAWGNLFELFATYSHEKFGELFWSKRASQDMPIAPGFPLGWKMPGPTEWPMPRIPLASSFINEYDASFASGSLSALVPNPWLAHKLGVKVRCEDCSFRNSGGRCLVQSSSMRQPGAEALLCRTEEFRGLAKKEKLTPVWIVIGEKHVHRSESTTLPTSPWMQGLYWMEDGQIAGEHRVER